MEDYRLILDEYIDSVLVALWPKISSGELHSFSVSQSPSDFNLELKMNSFSGFNNPYNTNCTSFIHFTSLKALHSILNESALRLYNMNNVNDPKEMEHLVESDSNLNHIVYEMKKNTYVLSMCCGDILNSDEILNLWRLYGNNGNGVAIELEIDMQGVSNFKFLISDIHYNKLNIAEFMNLHRQFEEKKGLKVGVADVLAVPSCFHKSRYYKVESEVRMLFMDSSNSFYDLSDMTRLDSPFFYDFDSRGELVSYFKLALNEESMYFPKVTIKSIQIGFKYSKESFKEIKNHLTNFLRYKDEFWRKGTSEMPIIEQSPLTGIYR